MRQRPHTQVLRLRSPQHLMLAVWHKFCNVFAFWQSVQVEDAHLCCAFAQDDTRCTQAGCNACTSLIACCAAWPSL